VQQSLQAASNCPAEGIVSRLGARVEKAMHERIDKSAADDGIKFVVRKKAGFSILRIHILNNLRIHVDLLL
jgi:hypothetical protein